MAVRDVVQAAAGVGGGDNLYVEDVFSTYLYTGNGATQTIENGIALGDSNFGGSGVFTSGDYLEVTPEVIGAGDFTIEFWVNHDSITYYQTPYVQGYGMAGSFIIQTGNSDGKWLVYIDGSIVLSETTSTVNTNTWYHIAITRSGSTIRLFRDGVQTGSGTSSVDVNFSGAASISYPTAPLIGRVSNFRYVKGTALYTSAFTPPTSALTAISGTKLLTLQGDTPFLDNSTNALSITNVGTVSASKGGPYIESGYGEGGLVWIKRRNGVGDNTITDTIRGPGKELYTNQTWDQQNYTGTYGVSVFNSTGFSLIGNNAPTNGTNLTYASWTFRKAPKFFDVVTYTGTGVARTVSHNLGSVPGCIIVKGTSGSNSNWMVYHRANTSAPETDYLILNGTDATTDTSSIWNDTAPTDTEFTVGDQNFVNASGVTYVAYLFAHDAGGFGDDGEQNVISCGSFVPSAIPLDINLGYEPQWVMIKNASGVGDWWMLDNMRAFTAPDTPSAYLKANLSNSEASTTGVAAVTSTGFQFRLTSSSDTYIYIAIRRPMKTPESGTEVFSANFSDGVEPIFSSGFPVDLGIYAGRSNAYKHYFYDRLRGSNPSLNSTNTSAEQNNGEGSFDNMDGWGVGIGSSTDYVSWMFRRAPGFMDVVAYTTEIGSFTRPHNLGVAPEIMILKNRGGFSWYVMSSAAGTDKTFLMETNVAPYISRSYWPTDPDASNLYLGGQGGAYPYIAYLFASLAGISKCGSYIGTGANLNVDCGFSSGARFVLIKRYDGTPGSNVGDWYVWDSARGIVAGNDPYLLLNSTAAENTSTDYIDPLASGFTVTSSAPAALNASGGTYIFLAIA